MGAAAGGAVCAAALKGVPGKAPLGPAGGTWAQRALVCASVREAAFCEVSFLFFYFSAEWT